LRGAWQVMLGEKRLADKIASKCRGSRDKIQNVPEDLVAIVRDEIRCVKCGSSYLLAPEPSSFASADFECVACANVEPADVVVRAARLRRWDEGVWDESVWS